MNTYSFFVSVTEPIVFFSPGIASVADPCSAPPGEVVLFRSVPAGLSFRPLRPGWRVGSEKRESPIERKHVHHLQPLLNALPYLSQTHNLILVLSKSSPLAREDHHHHHRHHLRPHPQLYKGFQRSPSRGKSPMRRSKELFSHAERTRAMESEHRKLDASSSS